MRIILVQAEIELALRNYVFSQINVAEGQDITIDFKNTRGEDGATADINITTAQATGGRTAAPLVQTKTSAPKPSTASAAPAVEATVDTTTQEEKAPAQPASTSSEPEGENQKEEALPNEAAEETTEEAAEETFKENQGEIEAVTKPVGEDAPAPPKSLFANLVKPVNAKN
jgi:hypothetical protein